MIRAKRQTVHELLAALDAYQEIVSARGGYIRITSQLREQLTPEELAMLERRQANYTPPKEEKH